MSETESVDLEREELGKYADLFSLEVAKPVRLSLHLIVQRHLPPDARNWSHDKILEALQKITHLRLDRENISEIDGLELLGERVTNVYLQSNIIKRIENFECLKNLQFLTLSGNQIQSIENLKHLQRLFFLDLSFNLINDFDIDEFPMSLIILNLKGNPCTSHPDHRGRIIQDLPKLKQLDDVEISSEEKLEAGFKTEESEEEEEDDDDNEEIDKEIPGKDTAEFKDITQLTNSTLVRSQQRLEMDLGEHLKHSQELDLIREKYNIPSSRTTKTPRKGLTQK